ncbi:MAG: hypothetical protein NT136_00850 [Candidatus Moranbacteria bacterium]|nr:hypothetical protein [Candidatus Moranbacteria bacterium]
MKPFWKKYRTHLIIPLYLAFIGLVFYFSVRPLIGKINETTNRIQEGIANQENRKKRLEELPKLREQFEMIKNEEENFFPLLTEDRVVELIEKIEMLAENTGNTIIIEVQEFKGKDAAGAKKGGKTTGQEEKLRSELPGSDYLEMKIKLAGNYNNLVDFTRKIETMEYHADIVSFEISVKPDTIESQQRTPDIFSTTDSALDKKITSQEAENITEKKEIALNSVINAVFYLKK